VKGAGQKPAGLFRQKNKILPNISSFAYLIFTFSPLRNKKVYTAEHLTHPGKTFGSRLNYTSMLNFFKLPFRGRSRAVSDQRNLPFLTVGLLKIYLRSENVSGDISEKAETTMRELEAMQREVSHSTPQDSYEIMVAALRRIEDSLD
jgi:hypothetical protein